MIMKNYFLLVLALIMISCGSKSKKQINTSSDNDSIFMVKNDTIAMISDVNHKDFMAYVITERIYKECDIDTINNIIAFFSDKIEEDYTIFFYLNKKINDGDWYGSYYKGRFGTKIKNEGENEPPKEHIEDIIEMMRSDINKSGLDFVYVFLAKKYMFYESVKKCNNQSMKAEYINFLVKNYPKARMEYYKRIRDELWEKDIVVKIKGRNIKFYGYMFVSNKVVKDTYEEIKHELEKLRFNKCYFGWIEDEDEHRYIVSELKDNNI